METQDSPSDAEWLAHKIANMRIFNDPEGVMNCSLLETGGDLIAVSQFTLLAATKKGHRPSYIRAARPAEALPSATSVLSCPTRSPRGQTPHFDSTAAWG